MNPDDFEKHLRRQPLRQIPQAWRAEILQRAKPSALSSLNSHPSTLASRLSALLWPHPKAWASLAGAWLVIIALHLAASDRIERVAKKTDSSPADTLMVLQQKQQLLAELFGPALPKDADRPKPTLLQPRSDRRSEILAA